KMIKRCNDFGAGGVSVAIGELADGLMVNLNAVPKKYDGLDGTELAISESQERMAVVVAPENVDKFVEYASAENLDATIVAKVTEEKRLRLAWNDKFIVDLSREFLNSNGADKHTTVKVAKQEIFDFAPKGDTFAQKVENLASDLNICSQKGLVERFDSTIGSNTVLMPFGGKNQLTPTQAMVAKIPVLDGKTNTVSCMAWGFNPYVSEKSPYLSAMYAVIESVAKIIAAGGSYKKAWLTFQEYFEKIGTDSTRWGKVFSALLGALESQLNLGIAAIGGKDSMSGTFEDINVPPTLVSFAVSATKAQNIISPEFKKAGSKICVITPSKNADGTADFDSVRDVFDKVEKLIADKKVLSAWAISFGGVLEGVFKMALGNEIGMSFDSTLADDMLFGNNYGGFVLEMADDTEVGTVIGKTTAEYELAMGNDVVSLADIQSKWEAKLAPVFPYRTKVEEKSCVLPAVTATSYKAPAIKCQKPKVLIPVFPGTNCEYDTARAFEDEGCEADIFVIKNLTSADITESINAFEQKIMGSQIIAVPGGFSGGDEPDGSAKFITSFFRNPKIKDAVSNLLKNRDGLMLGICNGFQALIKLGLVTYGEIVDATPDSPTLTFNTIGRHQSMMVRTNIVSNKSPWLMHTKPGDSHLIAISHGEGRFIANDEWIKKLVENGQVATQYINLEGVPTYDSAFNPNNSVYAIEGITSPDGRVLGKMGHSERFGKDIVKNIEGNKDQQIFKAAFDYFNL
ncbi:MAG: phosphoribosylformylglycinamidine synthase, partial [Oscillospiraceae bacterium]|nr:phosphoribosylformylglycinamidine synthase [Oscillospiraceae bacterium]